MEQSPLILAFVSDLIFSSRIEQTAERQGLQVRVIENADQIASLDLRLPGRSSAGHLNAREVVLLYCLTQWRPILIIFDLGNASIPWSTWIELITGTPATRRIPVLCYCSQVNVNAIRSAQQAGAWEVLVRSHFVNDLPNLIQKYARKGDWQALDESCQQSLSAEAIRGFEEFNRGEYFEAHESLEYAWKVDETPSRELYRAVLQVAVAYYQILRGNYRGALKMFLRVRQWIDPLPDRCRGVDIAGLREEARAVHRVLIELGPERIKDFDRNLLKPVKFELEEGYEFYVQ